jgi:hypothetical protein
MVKSFGGVSKKKAWPATALASQLNRC